MFFLGLLMHCDVGAVDRMDLYSMCVDLCGDELALLLLLLLLLLLVLYFLVVVVFRKQKKLNES
jgi:predicted neutral ceramidase superfamily lipid hydrolase